LITALLVTANWTAFQTNSILIDISTPVLGADVYLPVFVVFPILVFIFSKKYGWTNWKEKLTGTIEKPVITNE
ncbi:MAG: CPBP family intramembrane metalloprotease domain-containing protein, partial [Polaribacter sp.]|nr:CPBP family intramembrane metalloprotease domain-containing protein [Polaribacter sp.]